MSIDIYQDTRRQVEICNACRYCEGFCSVFPGIHRRRDFSDADLTQLANLCHNCRGCYYACQFTPPHEFNINLPRTLAELRQLSWRQYAWPGYLARLFQRGIMAATTGLVLSLVLFIYLVSIAPAAGKNGFYALVSHGLMVSIFLPVFLLPLVSIARGIGKYWRDVDGSRLRWADLKAALAAAAKMKNLDGGHGDGCNFEQQDAYSNSRRYFHQATMWGFLLCFAATSSATILHYLFAMPAPYPVFSLPKLFGLSGGLLLCVGTAGLAWLKTRADRELGAPAEWPAEMAFTLLLFLISASGLMLYLSTGTDWVAFWLPLHLASVMTLFLLTPFSKMAHGFFRLAALCRYAQIENGR